MPARHVWKTPLPCGAARGLCAVVSRACETNSDEPTSKIGWSNLNLRPNETARHMVIDDDPSRRLLVWGSVLCRSLLPLPRSAPLCPVDVSSRAEADPRLGQAPRHPLGVALCGAPSCARARPCALRVCSLRLSPSRLHAHMVRRHFWAAAALLQFGVDEDGALGQAGWHCILDELDADAVDSVSLVGLSSLLAEEDVAQVRVARVAGDLNDNFCKRSYVAGSCCVC